MALPRLSLSGSLPVPAEAPTGGDRISCAEFLPMRPIYPICPPVAIIGEYFF